MSEGKLGQHLRQGEVCRLHSTIFFLMCLKVASVHVTPVLSEVLSFVKLFRAFRAASQGMIKFGYSFLGPAGLLRIFQ